MSEHRWLTIPEVRCIESENNRYFRLGPDGDALVADWYAMRNIILSLVGPLHAGEKMRREEGDLLSCECVHCETWGYDGVIHSATCPINRGRNMLRDMSRRGGGER